MKRWSIRLLALSLVLGLGWFGVTWAQQRWGTQDTPGPDFSKRPVNADAIEQADNAKTPNGMGVRELKPASSRSAPADPFQASSIALASNEAPAAQSTAATGRYQGAEPRRLDSDPYAAPISQDAQAAAARTNTLRDDIPAADTSVGNSARAAQYDNVSGSVPNDPFGLQNAGSTAAAAAGATVAATAAADSIPDQNQRFANGGSARQTSGIAAPTGALEPVNDDRGAAAGQFAQATPNNDRYGSSGFDNRGGGRYGSDAQEPAATPNVRTMQSPSEVASQESRLPENFRSNSNARAAQNPAAARGAMPYGNSTTGSGSLGNDYGSAATSTPVNVEGLGRPGEKKLEGPQNPSVTIEKIAPAEIQVNKPATFEIHVRNTGPVQAENVEVTDVVPQGTQFINSTPRTTLGQRGEILWKVGDLKPGEEAKLQLELMPLTEGEIGSMAVVQFRSTASMRTIATKPEIVLELTAPKQVMIGEDTQMHLKLSNPGTGAANKVTLQAKIPAGFQHPAGSELEFDVGQFRPGETRELDLTLKAIAAGQFAIAVSVQGDAQIHTEKNATIQIVAPAVQLQVAGPGLRYLDRQAKYTVTVANPGTASARDINLTARLPKGMQFVEASDSGRFDSATNSVLWALDELPAGQSGSVTLTALAKEAGEQKLRGEVRAAGGLSETTEQVTNVEGVAAVLFTVADVDDPVEVGGRATYEIKVVNQGSKAASRLQIVATFPPEMKPVSGEGPTRQTIEGQRVIFEPMQRLGPKADITYRVIGQCLKPGDARMQVELMADEMQKPVVKEESTRVYKD
jgi:uncharacterized repeat protein (TIGR01451 family)